MLLLWQSTVTKHPYYQPPDVAFTRPKEEDDDDDLFLAVWFMFMRQPYEKRLDKDSA